MSNSALILRRLIQEIAIIVPPETHRTMRGKDIPFGCVACIVDIESRIEDAKYRRDKCIRRSDAREHHNGLLKVLRRELRAARKIQDAI